MSYAVFAGTLVAVALLMVASAVQLLYLESLRLRTRDLPSLEFFKSSVEEKIGLETDQGALSFSLIKHATLPVLGVLVLGNLLTGAPAWQSLLEACVTALSLMLAAAYAIPQILYRRTGGKWLVPLIPMLRLLALAMKPAAATFNFFYSIIEAGDQNNRVEEAATPAENIEALIEAGAEEGLIEEEDRKLIQSVVEFGDKVVREVMTPRPNIVAISADATLEELRQLVINEQYSRIPIFEGSIDQIIGFVHVRDMFELEEDERARRSVRELTRPMRFVPESKPVHDLMREMQQDGAHMVIVVDEYGNTAGLASMEDLVEVILGEIRDEHEPSSDVTEDGEGGYIVSGNFDLARLEDMLEFRPQEEIESTTVGGLVTEWLGRVPQAGEFVERDGIHIDVLASDDRRVERVRARKSQAVGA